MNKVEDFLYADESKLIYDASHEVWKEFGGDFKELVVDNALTIALESKKLSVEDQKRIDLYFQGKKVGVYVLDKVIGEKIVIELKCKEYLTKHDERQFWRYLRATDYKLGFLISYSPTKLEIKRRIFDKARSDK